MQDMWKFVNFKTVKYFIVGITTPSMKICTYENVPRYGITYGLLCTELEDAIKERDGPRVTRCRRFFLPIFKATDRPKY